MVEGLNLIELSDISSDIYLKNYFVHGAQEFESLSDVFSLHVCEAPEENGGRVIVTQIVCTDLDLFVRLAGMGTSLQARFVKALRTAFVAMPHIQADRMNMALPWGDKDTKSIRIAYRYFDCPESNGYVDYIFNFDVL